MKRSKGYYTKRDYQAYLYILPWLIGLLILQLYPFAKSLYYSFTNYTIGSVPEWIGLKNYIKLFTRDKDFWKSLTVTLQYTVTTVPLKLIMALAVAMFLNRDIKGINLIRTLYYIPSLFGGSIAISILWKLLFQENGVINTVIRKMGMPGFSFLGDTRLAMPTLCALEIWMFGSSMVMFLAALKNVPKDLYEAADIDGAGKVKQFFSITIPQITPIIFFTLIMQLVQAMQNYTSAAIVTSGGPLKSTYVLGMKLYDEGFGYMKMGYASSVAWVTFIIIVVFTMLLFKSSSAWVFYGDEDK